MNATSIRALNGLALLASGNKEWIPLAKREAQWAADFKTDGYLSWYYGYNMALCVSVMEPARWGSGKRIDPCVKFLQRYGTHAKTVLPQLRELREQFAAAAGGKAKSGQAGQLDKAIAAIESCISTPTLVSVADFKARPAK